MIRRSLYLALSLLLVFSVCAFAGEGSDTVGACKLLPELRYGYSVSEWDSGAAVLGPFTDWDVKSHDYYAQLNWGLHSNFDVIALVGGRSVSAESELGIIDLRTGSVPMFLWGFGFKGTFFRADNGFYVGGGVLFTHSFSGDYSLKTYLNGVLINTSGEVYRRSIFRVTPDIHVGWNFKNIGLTPYLGVDYTWGHSITKIDLGATNYNINYELQDPWEMYGGIDYYLNDKLYLNAEGRTNFNDGWGVGAGIGYKFDLCAKPAPAPEPAPAPVIEPKLEPMSKN